MPSNLTAPFLLALCFLTLFGFAEFLYHSQKVKAEVTRKIVHVGTGLLTLLFPVFLHNQWQVLFLCASFLVILLASLRYKFLPSINGVDRITYGSLLYPVAVYGCYFTYIQSHKGLLFFYLPILILAICDPLAALAGKRYPFGKYKIGMAKKTISGSLAFFLSSFLVTVCCFWFNTTPDFKLAAILPATFLITTTATAVEAISAQGSDNIFIPSVVVLNLTLIL